MASVALCDGVMECDSAVCISEGQGDVLTRVTSDGNVQFDFPDKPAHVKIMPHEMCLTPWRCQGEKGTVTETNVVEAADGPKQMYDGYLRGHIEKLLHGENLVCTSFGEAKTRKMGLIFGDEKSKHGALYYFFEELFAAEHMDLHHVTMSAYSFSPSTEEVTDLIGTLDVEKKPYLRDGDARRAGSDVAHLQAAFLADLQGAVKEIEHLKQSIEGVRQKEVDRVDKRAEEMNLKSSRKTKEGDEVLDFDFGASATPSKPKTEETVSSYIPEPYYDTVICVNVLITTGGEDAAESRTSTRWANASFIVLPDNTRPTAVGALSQDDVKRYEKVQRLVCATLAILTAIRLKRRRVPFLSHKWCSTLRFAFRQTGEKEDDRKLIKNSSFRKRRMDGTPDDESPRAKKAEEAPPTRVFVIMNICKRGEEALESFHAFVCAKRFKEMCVSNTGMPTRHLAVEQAQMDREIASLILQLEVAKAVHNYRPMLFGVATKSKDDKSIQERESAALEKKKVMIQQAANERKDRITGAAQHIADRNIAEELARLAQVQQQYDDLKARMDQKREELNKWESMTFADLNKEIHELTTARDAAESRVAKLEAHQTQLRRDEVSTHKDLEKAQTTMQENQRKAMRELEARQAAVRVQSEKRRVLVKARVDEMRAEIVEAGKRVLQQAQQLVDMTKKTPGRSSGTPHADATQMLQNLTHGITGLAGILPRILPGDYQLHEEQQRRIELVRGKIMKGANHELLSLQASLRADNVPLPVFTSEKPAERPGPLVRLHIKVLGVAGLEVREHNKFSVALQVRGGGVIESPRLPMKGDAGRIDWNHTFKLAHRLPGDKGNVGRVADFASFAVSEFLPDGSFSEALPFDIDLNSVACKPTKVYQIIPCKSSRLKLAFQVSTFKMKPKQTQLNPLYTPEALQAVKKPTLDDYGPSSDEE